MAKSRQQPAKSGGVYVALATPRRPQATEADAAVLLDYIDAIVRTGVDGIVLFGATGEFVHFDLEERMRLLSFAIRRSRVPVLVNVSHSSLAGAAALAQDAVAAGAAGLLLMPPYFYRYDDDQVLSFYREFSLAVDDRMPRYLYNLPVFTNRISVDVAETLLRSGAYTGIKDSSGEWQMFQALHSLKLKFPFTLMIGSESLYLEARRTGADGIVSGIAAALPELIVAMDRAIQANDHERSCQLNHRLREFLTWVDRFPAPVAIKQTAVARGWKLDHAAFPLGGHTNAELENFRGWLKGWLPSVLSECAEGFAAMKA